MWVKRDYYKHINTKKETWENVNPWVRQSNW